MTTLTYSESNAPRDEYESPHREPGAALPVKNGLIHKGRPANGWTLCGISAGFMSSTPKEHITYVYCQQCDAIYKDIQDGKNTTD